MQNYFIIGVGGCGNKIVAQGVDSGVISKNSYLLMNSTDKDIPAGHKSIVFSEDKDYGCAKNRAASKTLIIDWLQNGGDRVLADMIPETVDCVIVVNSTEGGTGSGAASIICQYCVKDLAVPAVINIPVFGFSDSASGCKNSIDYMKDMCPEVAILPVSNQKAQKTFETVGVNTFKTESQVNLSVLEQIKAVIGTDIRSSEQNIDAADHLAIIGNSGLMVINTIDLSDIRDIKTFNSAIIESIAHSIGFDIDPSLTTNNVKMGIYLNITDSRLDFIGNDFSVLKKRLFGEYTPSTFTHKQYAEEYGEFARIIISGMEIPIDEANKFKAVIEQESARVSSAPGSFFDQIQDVNVNITEAPKRTRSTSGSFLDSLSSEDSAKEAEQVLNNRGGRGRRGARTAATSSPVATTTSADAQSPKAPVTTSGNPMVSGNKTVIHE